MSSFLDTDQLATVVKTRRGERGLREIAQEIGRVSPSTLSRVENGKMLDVETFLHLCDWLQTAPQEFIKSTDATKGQEMSTCEQIAILLRRDSNLPPEAASALVTLLKVAYNTLSRRAHAQE